MERQLEQLLSNAGQSKSAYGTKTWHKIIYSLLDDFQKYIGRSFELPEKSDISLDIQEPLDPTFTVWISSPKKEENAISPSHFWLSLINNTLLQIEDKNSLSVVKWEAVIGGQMAGSYRLGENKEIFYASATIFLFDPISEKRLCLETGENIVDCVYQPQPDGSAKWSSYGWSHDAYYEWEDIDSWSNII